MEKTLNVDLEKLDKLLEVKAHQNIKISESETMDEHARARFRSVGVELTTVRHLLRDPDFFTAIWDIYMKDDV